HTHLTRTHCLRAQRLPPQKHFNDAINSWLCGLTSHWVRIGRFMFQAPAPTPWPSQIGTPPQALFERYFHDGVYKTWGNISPLYKLDEFDWLILIVYFTIL